MIRKILRYVAIGTFLTGLISIWLLLRKPTLTTSEPTPNAARSFTDKVAQLTLAHEQGQPSEIRLTEAEINSQIEEGLKNHPPPPAAAGVKSAKVHLEGDRLIALLAMNVRGQDVYVTVGGNLNFADRSVRLVPSEVRVGSLPVPVSWLEGRIDMHMEVPEGVTAMRVENGELVIAAQ